MTHKEELFQQLGYLRAELCGFNVDIELQNKLLNHSIKMKGYVVKEISIVEEKLYNDK